MSARILVVDDEPTNIDLIVEMLQDQDYQTESTDDGIKALELLEKSPKGYDAVLLDRRMPNMDGIEVLKKIKSHDLLRSIPVIMQSVRAAKKDILEGLQAGAYYYLTKPFDEKTMLAIVKAALTDRNNYRSLLEKVQSFVHSFHLMKRAFFEIQTLEDADALSVMMAHAHPNPKKVVIGLYELFVNAIEHGNLNITYKEKSKLMESDKWENEVARRLRLSENVHKKVRVEYRFENNEFRFLIKDQGKGFDWKKYLDIDPDRAFDLHGRGIFTANKISFDRMEYKSVGNEVEVAVRNE